MPGQSVNAAVLNLVRVSEAWLDPQSALRRKAVDALVVSTGYGSRMIERAIDNAFQELREDKLLAFIAQERLRPFRRSDQVVLHIAAGNVFTSWLHGAVISLLMGFRCWIKPSAQEPLFARFWHQSIQMVDLALGERIGIVEWKPELLSKAQAVVAYGSDATLTTLKDQTPPQTLFIGYGHKLSVAVALVESWNKDEWPIWRERAMADCDLFELNGCLSPQAIFIEGTGDSPWDKLAPHAGPLPELRHFIDLEDLVLHLKEHEGRLSCAGVAGPLARVEPVRTALEALGVSRICELGSMQRPPLSWKNGGISLVRELAPLLDRRAGAA